MSMRGKSGVPQWVAISVLSGFLLGADASATDALMAAVKASDSGAVRARLGEGDDANAADTDGTSALLWAVHADDVGSARALLESGADVSRTNRFDVGPLYLASENGSAEMIRLLLEHGADPNAALPEGETALMTAARTGTVAAIDVLIEAGADVDAVERRKGQTALMWAAAEGNTDAVSALLAAGADIEARSANGEFGALTFAVRGGAIDTVRALLDAGADVSAEMSDGTSMLVLAAINAHYEVAALLLERGADANADRQGWTALHQIAWSRRWNRGFNHPGPSRTGNLNGLDLARKLVEAGANVNARQHAEPADGNRNKLDRIGATPFLLAAKSCDVPLMRALLELGADASIHTEDGTSALMAAAGVGIWAPGENPGTHEESLAAVELALESGGGDVMGINEHGDTVIHGAVYRGGNISVVEHLAALGAPLNVVNDLGWTPLIAARGVEYTPDVLKRYPDAAEVLVRLMNERGIDPESAVDAETFAATQ